MDNYLCMVSILLLIIQLPQVLPQVTAIITSVTPTTLPTIFPSDNPTQLSINEPVDNSICLVLLGAVIGFCSLLVIILLYVCWKNKKDNQNNQNKLQNEQNKISKLPDIINPNNMNNQKSFGDQDAKRLEALFKLQSQKQEKEKSRSANIATMAIPPAPKPYSNEHSQQSQQSSLRIQHYSDVDKSIEIVYPDNKDNVYGHSNTSDTSSSDDSIGHTPTGTLETSHASAIRIIAFIDDDENKSDTSIKSKHSVKRNNNFNKHNYGTMVNSENSDNDDIAIGSAITAGKPKEDKSEKFKVDNNNRCNINNVPPKLQTIKSQEVHNWN